jgi:hypothetical protein
MLITRPRHDDSDRAGQSTIKAMPAHFVRQVAGHPLQPLIVRPLDPYGRIRWSDRLRLRATRRARFPPKGGEHGHVPNGYRGRCGDCTFASLSHRQHSLYLEPSEVLVIAREGAALGCTEAMFTLGDKPGDRWRQARERLAAHGCDDTLSSVRATVIRVLEETGLLTYLNPGVMSWPDFQRLKPAAPSMGMMPGTTATRLFASKDPHFPS